MAKQESKAKTKTYFLSPVHINMIEAKARSMGQASASAGLRAILEEWEQDRKYAHIGGPVDDQTAALLRQ